MLLFAQLSFSQHRLRDMEASWASPAHSSGQTPPSRFILTEIIKNETLRHFGYTG